MPGTSSSQDVDHELRSPQLPKVSPTSLQQPALPQQQLPTAPPKPTHSLLSLNLKSDIGNLTTGIDFLIDQFSTASLAIEQDPAASPAKMDIQDEFSPMHKTRPGSPDLSFLEGVEDFDTLVATDLIDMGETSAPGICDRLCYQWGDESFGAQIPPVVPGFKDLRLLYRANHLQIYRANSVATGKGFALKLCSVNHFDTIARLRNEWKILAEIQGGNSKTYLLSQSSFLSSFRPPITNTGSSTRHPNIVRPYGWDYLPNGGMTLIYPNHADHLIVREVFLPGCKNFLLEAHTVASPPVHTARARTHSDLMEILSVMSDVVHALSVAHQIGVRHYNVNTYSILVKKGAPGLSHPSIPMLGRLGGWHLSSRLEREESGRTAPNTMPNGENLAALQYIAPECTGRMNRPVDYRADFYSFGVSLYELVVGFLPFRAMDPLELIHQHIAQPPTPPSDVNSSIPPALSAIIIKLLEKNVEDRYQTALGLRSDLDMVVQRLAEGSPLEEIRVGELDTTSQFLITEELYGRERPISLLKAAYERCSEKGGCAMVMVRGSSGVGKSRMVNEIGQRVVGGGGYFTTGKFDQYKRGFSFFTVIQTFQDLIRQILSESVQSQARWRKDIIRALDADTAVLVDVAPEVKLLLGPDYKIETISNLGPAEREARLRDVFGRFLAVFGKKGLVLFVDDLQWGSSTEINLLAGIASEANRRLSECEVTDGDGETVTDDADPNPSTEEGIEKESMKSARGGILFIGAYRDTEVDEGHPLTAMLKHISNNSTIEVIDIEIGPLDQDSIRRIIGDTLHRNPESGMVKDDPEMQTLTELVYARTRGNAFFVIQLLKSLHRGGHITFDFSVEGGGRWRFNLTSIEADDLPSTVVDLLVKQMLKLSEETRMVLMLAACVGAERVSLGVLSVAAGRTIEQTANALWGALDAGLILPVGGNFRAPLALERQEEKDMDEVPKVSENFDSYFPQRLSPIPEKSEEQVTYRFLHDRVQQAAYSLIQKDNQAGFHRTIGMRLLETFSEEERGPMLYEIVNQLNHWLSPLEDSQCRFLMELNLRAGRKAIASTAFDATLNYLLVAKGLADSVEKGVFQARMGGNRGPEELPTFDETDEVIIDINLALMEGHFAQNDYEKSIALADKVFPRFTRPKDKIKCLIYKMNSLLAQGKLHETIETGLQGLSILSWEIPFDDEEARLHTSRMRPRILLDVPEIREIGRMHDLEDENFLLLQDVISILVLPAYMARPALLPAIVFTSVVISLEYGISTAGAYPMLMTGVILGAEGTQENLLRSYAYGKLAVSIIEKDDCISPVAPGIYEVYAGHIGIFHQSMHEVLQYLQKAVTCGMGVFNVDYTIFAMAEIPAFGMFGGENLAAVQNKMMAAKPTISKFKQESGMWWLSLPLQFALNLQGIGNPDPICFEGGELGGVKDLTKIIASESMSHVYVYHMYRLIVAAIYGYHEIVAVLATYCCEPLNEAAVGTFYCGLTGFYSSIAFLEMYDSITDQQKVILERNINDIRQWSVTAKGTWLHKSVLLEAEIMRAKQHAQQLEILDKYDQAISLATKSGFINDAALIHERCGAWLHGFHRRRAAPYLREAFKGYTLWGATSKAMELRKQYPDEILFKDNRPMLNRADGESVTSVTSLNTTVNTIVSPRPSPRSSRMYSTPEFVADQSQMPQYKSPSLTSSKDIYATDAHDVDDVASHASSIRNNETSSLGSELDFRTVLKASLVISEGIHLEEVIVKLMKSVLQTAGADYGVLILKEDADLHIETVGLIEEVSILEHEPLSTRADLVPISIVKIVASLGEQILKEGNGSKFDATYGRDVYFQTRRAKSVLCMPIQNQLKTMGVLYLENKLVSHAFTRQRQELLNLLCTQAAVTIDKARLYRHMELAKKAAEEATAEKSTFLANMSHEIRTPFNALLSCSIFLLDTELTEQQREYVETIRNSAVLTLQIIDGILDFSKIEYGALDLQNAPFSLRDCIESSLQLSAEPASTKDLELVYRNNCSNIDLIHGDLTRFRQCVINLTGNAVKFTENGHILVTTYAQKLPDDELWEIKVSVQDTGIGIPQNSFDRLFRAFSQVDTSTRRQFGGTGLGLAISKKLAQMMGGDIWFESQEGIGTTFHLTIRAAVTEKTRSNKRFEGKRIIVADTHPLSSAVLVQELETEGMLVTHTNGVDTTLEAMHNGGKNHFEIALIDFSVDKTCVLVDQINKFDPEIRVIMMSRFGESLPPNAVKYNIAVGFVRPAPRARYMQAVQDALNPGQKHRVLPARDQEGELLRSLAKRHPLNILLAEDNPVNTRVALQHLKRMGYSAEHAKDGIEVLEMCEAAAKKNKMFDVVLMDIQMPRADGIETSLILHKKYTSEERPTIIALTANATANDREKCKEAGMLSHIAKPILPNDLAAALMSTATLENRRQQGR